MNNHYKFYISGGTHALPLEIVKKVFEMWHHNNLINHDDSEWEIGMGLPLFSLSLGGYFRSIVASETDIDWYCNVVNYFEALGRNKDKGVLVVKPTHPNDFYEKPSNTLGCKNKLPPRKVVMKNNCKIKSAKDDYNLSDSEKYSLDHSKDDTSEEYSFEESTDDSSSSDDSGTIEDDEPL